LSELVKLRSLHAKIRVLRAAVALPEISPEEGSDEQGHDRGSDSYGGDCEQQQVRIRQDEIDELCRAAYNRGHAEGTGSARNQFQSEYDSNLLAEKDRIDGLMATMREQFSVLYGSTEEAVVKFAFGVAERIIRREVSLDRSIVLSQIRESVRRVLGVERVTIRVHPDDLVCVREQKGVIQANGDSIREIVVEGDEGLEPGDCVLESEMGNIDARLSTQLKQIENVLFESKAVS
jgi:flagellar assembly protein FliH